jgi:DMSO/TMAO reductase YedYZ molybdopterin-dependent catalytic subunit
MSARTAILLALALFASPACAAGVAIEGAVQHPATVTAEDLQKLPPVTVPISFQTDKGVESATYTGALLWTVMTNAAPVDAAGKNARLRHTALVTGSDGYAVSLSEGEIDPMFEGKSVILAYAKDGKPLDPSGSIRLVVPGDKHGGRAVRDVVRIDVQ